jgi:hypothetical protein
MLEQRGIADREVFLLLLVLERGRQADGAMFTGTATGLPERVLQAVGQGFEALATLDDTGVLPAREGQHAVVQAVIERHAGDRDARVGHDGEVRQATRTRFVLLGKEDLLGWASHRPPMADPSFERAAHTVRVLAGVVVLKLAQNRDGLQSQRVGQHGDDFGVPHLDEWIWARTPMAARLL